MLAERGSKKSLARKTGIPQSRISEYAAGKRLPTIEKLIAMSESLNVAPQWLLFGEPERGNEHNYSFILAYSGDEKDLEARLAASISKIPEEEREKVFQFLEALAEGDESARLIFDFYNYMSSRNNKIVD